MGFGWLVAGLQAIINGIGGLFVKLWTWLNELWQSAWNLGLDLLQQVMDYVMTLLPEGAKDTLNTLPWASMRGYMDDVNWFIPIYGLLSIILSTYALAGTIRAGRWIKSFIPTIGD